LDIHSLLDLTIELFGLLGGSCAGAYTLGMFTTRANWQGTAIGIVAASVITLVAWIFALVHPYFYLAIAIVMSIVIGYLASLLFPPPTAAQLDGLTVFTGGGRRGRPDIEPERLASTSTS
jgi:Na+/proline symporter